MAYKLTGIDQEQLINSYVYGYMNFGEKQAERYQQDMRECFDLLNDNPRIAHVREGYRQSFASTIMLSTTSPIF